MLTRLRKTTKSYLACALVMGSGTLQITRPAFAIMVMSLQMDLSTAKVSAALKTWICLRSVGSKTDI